MGRKSNYGKQTGPAVTYKIPTPAGGVQLETFIPWTLVRRSAKSQIIPPPDAPQEFRDKGYAVRPVHKKQKHSALMRALGLAHYWQRLLNEGRFNSLTDIAKAEGIDLGRASRIFRLASLAPEVIEQLVDTQDISLERVIRRSWPSDWSAQLRQLQDLAPQT